MYKYIYIYLCVLLHIRVLCTGWPRRALQEKRTIVYACEKSSILALMYIDYYHVKARCSLDVSPKSWNHCRPHMHPAILQKSFGFSSNMGPIPDLQTIDTIHVLMRSNIYLALRSFSKRLDIRPATMGNGQKA